MGKTNFQYDESGNTFYYFLLTFLSFILFPSTYYFWPEEEKVGGILYFLKQLTLGNFLPAAPLTLPRSYGNAKLGFG